MIRIFRRGFMSRKVVTRSATPQPDVRRVWVRPAVSKMKAGDAEVGPNPDNADGAFSFS
jgi:hypothetical protein